MNLPVNDRELIERKAFFIWCDQGKPDGEEMVDFGFGQKTLREYNWIMAEMEVEAELHEAKKHFWDKAHPQYGIFCPYIPESFVEEH